jgi:hypothetical protein
MNGAAMLTEERQKEQIRNYLRTRFCPSVPADEEKNYSVHPLADRNNWYGIFKACDLYSEHRRLEVGSEWWEGGIPGATFQLAHPPIDIQKAKEHASQFIGESK